MRGGEEGKEGVRAASASPCQRVVPLPRPPPLHSASPCTPSSSSPCGSSPPSTASTSRRRRETRCSSSSSLCSAPSPPPILYHPPPQVLALYLLQRTFSCSQGLLNALAYGLRWEDGGGESTGIRTAARTAAILSCYVCSRSCSCCCCCCSPGIREALRADAARWLPAALAALGCGRASAGMQALIDADGSEGGGGGGGGRNSVSAAHLTGSIAGGGGGGDFADEEDEEEAAGGQGAAAVAQASHTGSRAGVSGQQGAASSASDGSGSGSGILLSNATGWGAGTARSATMHTHAIDDDGGGDAAGDKDRRVQGGALV